MKCLFFWSSKSIRLQISVDHENNKDKASVNDTAQVCFFLFFNVRDDFSILFYALLDFYSIFFRNIRSCYDT